MLLEATGLQAYYCTSHVLHGVDFRVGPGEIVALMGRNGMGKTTLLRSMLGHLPLADGEVRIDNTTTTGFEPNRIARMGIAYVPEGRGIFPNLSVRENLLMAARTTSGEPGQWTLERVLETFPRLATRLRHGGSRLSGGEQQMLTVGRALMTNPHLLFLDEATEGLAPLIAREIWSTLQHLRHSGISAVIVDRNFAALTRLADRCVILVKGRKVFDARPDGLLARPDLRAQYLGV
jgi:branched-chain amino acid transport system ATP-binding protein